MRTISNSPQRTMTPIAEKIRQNLNDTFDTIDREKITRWLMSRASNKDLSITDCHGQPIGTGLGCEFSGSVQLIFWSFIKPCIISAAQSACDTLDATLPSYSMPQRIDTLNFVEGRLKGFATRIYTRMIDLDRRMRGKGFPDRVPPYDPKREILEAEEIISQKIAILRMHHITSEPTGIWAAGKSFWLKHWQWIISALLALIALLITLIG